jgi:transcription antitermination factor NusG
MDMDLSGVIPEVKDNIKWYAIYTRSRHEEKVSEALQKKEFEIFLPKTEVWSKRKDRHKKILRPMFPGYLFIHTKLDNYTHLEILKTKGIVRILGNNGIPVPVSEEEILSLKILIESKIPVAPCDMFNKGDRVMVMEGPLKGVIGTFWKRRKNKDRLIISVELLNRAVYVEVDEWYVMKMVD